MPATSRVGDTVVATCCCHKSCVTTTGIIVEGSPNVMTNNKSTGRIGDIAVCGCGHVTMIVEGSPNVMTNTIPTGRVGDATDGCPVGIIVEGSPNVITNG